MSENPIEIHEPNLVMPDLDGIPEDDNAEPDDAGVEHLATPEQVDEVQE